MDIRKFAVEPTGRLHLRDANDELMYADGDLSKPMVINGYGPGSKNYANAQAGQQNRMIDKLKSKGKANQTAEQKANEVAEFLADCTVSFENIEHGGLTGRDLSMAVYSDISIGFVAEQFNKWLGDWGNFSKGSATS